MNLNIGKEVAALQRMTVRELRTRYAEVFQETTNARHKKWLVRRIAWRLQAPAEGDISERARQRAAELARDADLRIKAPKAAAPALPTVAGTLDASATDRLPTPGTIITRQRELQRIWHRHRCGTLQPRRRKFKGPRLDRSARKR